MAVGIAVMGVTGVTSLAVSRRVKEIGIRLAIGATPARIVAWVVASTGRFVIAGTALGVVACVAVRSVLAPWLFATSPLEPTVVAGGIAVVLGVALLGTYRVARRAGQADPRLSLTAK